MIMLLILIIYEKSLAIYYLFNIFSYIKVHVLIKSVEVGGEVSHDEQEEQQEHQLRGHLKLFILNKSLRVRVNPKGLI